MKILQKIGTKIVKNNVFSDLYSSQIIDDKFSVVNYSVNNNLIIFFHNAYKNIALASRLTIGKIKIYGTFINEIDVKNLPEKIFWHQVNNDNDLYKTVDFIKNKEGKIDLLLLDNIDYCSSNNLNQTNNEDFNKYFANQVLQMHKIINNVLPIMQCLKYGKIITLNSTFNTSYRGFHRIKQAAQLIYLETLMMENKCFNINVHFIDYILNKTAQEKIYKKIAKIIFNNEKKFYHSIDCTLSYWKILKIILPQSIFYKLLAKKIN